MCHKQSNPYAEGVISLLEMHEQARKSPPRTAKLCGEGRLSYRIRISNKLETTFVVILSQPLYKINPCVSCQQLKLMLRFDGSYKHMCGILLERHDHPQSNPYTEGVISLLENGILQIPFPTHPARRRRAGCVGWTRFVYSF